MALIQGDMDKVSEFTVRRLSNYFRILGDLSMKPRARVSVFCKNHPRSFLSRGTFYLFHPLYSEL